MKCEYCGSWLREVPDNRCCPNCGGPLGSCGSDEPAEQCGFPEPPLGVYSGVNGWLEIGKNSVRIRKEKIAFTKCTDYEVSYNELTGVVYQPAEGEDNGYLCLRCTLNQHTPFPADWSDGLSDPTAVVFKKGANAAFSKVNAFLQSCLELEFHKLQVPEIRFPDPPIGVYKGRMGTMEITQNAVCFVKKFPLSQQTVYRMPFEDLFAVVIEAPTWVRYGELKVRCWQNRRMGFGNCFYDYETSIFWDRHAERYVYGIYGFLKECARIANAAREER